MAIYDCYNIRFNTANQLLEMNTGNETWIPVPSSGGGSVTVEDIDSEASTAGQVITSNGDETAGWGNLTGNNQEVQYAQDGKLAGNDTFTWDGAVLQAPSFKTLVVNIAQSGDPVSPVEGDIWYNTTTHKMRGCSNLGALFSFDVTND